jgi:hypothetical protein
LTAALGTEQEENADQTLKAGSQANIGFQSAFFQVNPRPFSYSFQVP